MGDFFFRGEGGVEFQKKFINEIPLKINRHKKIKNCEFFVKMLSVSGEILRSTFSTNKKSTLEGDF